MPAEAGIQVGFWRAQGPEGWIPAFAGMTNEKDEPISR
jgi:hypothetical protein